MRKLKLFLACLLMAVLSIGQMWGAEESYAIAFKSTTTSNDGSQPQSTIANLISSGSDYVSSVTATKCYNGKSGYGIKVGASSGSSSIVLNLSSVGQVKPTKVVINACRYGSDTGNMNVTLNTGSATTKTLTSSLADYECTMDGNTTLTKITIAPTTKRIYVKSVTVTYTTGGDPDPVLESIAISGTPSTKTYDEGDVFDVTGLTVTGSYDIGDDAAITEGITWEARTSAVADDAAALNAYTLTAGQTALQVRATVSEIASSWFDVTGLTVNEHVVTPGEYDITPNNAFWGTSYSGNPPSGSPTSFSASKYDITVQYNKGSGSYLYINDSQTRIYPKNTLAISVPTGYNITSIVFTGTFSNTMTPSVGEYTSSTKTWEGKANSVTFTGGGTSGNNQCTKITVTYEAIAPEVTVDPASLSFTAKQNIAVEGKTFTLTGANLTSGLSLAASTGFSVSPTEITAADAMAQGGVEVTVTPATPTATTTPVEGTVTISGGGLSESVEIALSMSVTETYAVAVAVNDNTMGSATINGGTATVYAEYADDVNLVATPESGYEFVSWSASNDNIEIADVSSATTTATIGAAGTIMATFQAQACTGLAAPVLDEVTKTYQSATIAWLAVDNADGYVLNIVKHEGGVAVLTDEVIVAPAVSFEKTGLDANTQYDYTVMAVGDGTSYCDESNPTLAGSFTTSDYPAATLSLVENGGTPYNWGTGLKLNSVIALPDELAGLGCSDKVLVGWDADENCATAPTYAKGANYTIASTADVLYAVFATEQAGEVTKHDVFATTSLGSTNTVTSGFAVSAQAESKSGYYQDGSGTTRYVQVKVSNAETQIIPEAPTAITVKAKIGGGTAKDPLTNNVYAVLIDADQNAIGDPVLLTTKVTAATGSDFEASMPIANYANVRGARVTHEKETSYNVRYYAISLSYSTGGGVSHSGYTTECTAALPVLAAPTFPVAEGVFYENTDITISAATGASIYYTTDGTTPSSTNGTLYEGAITLNAYGTYNFKAIAVQAGHEDSEVAEATYYFGMTFASVSDLYTYLEANSLTSMNNVKVTGLVSRITTAWDAQKGYLTYYISDNGVAENDLQMYRGAGTGADVLAVGDQVTVTGNYTLFQSTTHEFGAGNTIVARTAAAVASVAIGGAAEKTTYSPEDNQFSHTGLTATATYNTGYTKDVTALATWTNNLENNTVAASGNVEVTATYEGESDTKDVTVTYTTKTLDHITLSYTSTTAYVGMALPTPTVTASYVEDIDDEDVTELVAAANGFDTESAYNGSAAGSYTINVSYTLGEVTESAEYTVTVKSIYNDESDPYTVAEALDLIGARFNTNTASADSIVVAGIVSRVHETQNNTYWISDDGTENNELEVYNGKYLNKASFSAATKLHVGDEVVVKGKVKTYQSTKEFDSNSRLVSLARTPNFEVADVVEALEVNISEDLGVEGLTITKDGEGEVTLVSSDETKVSIVDGKLHAVAVAENVEITANLAADGIYKAATTTFHVTVIAERTRYTVTFDANGGEGTDPEAIANQLAGATVDMPAACLYNYEGHGFTGWKVINLSTEAEIEVENDQFEMPAANVKIQAQWAVVATCAISFQVNGAEVATANAPQEADYNIPANTAHPTVDGFTFLGWSETEYADEVETAPTLINVYHAQAGEETKTLYGIYSRLEDNGNQHYVLDYSKESALASSTSWGAYGTAFAYTASDGSEWVVKAYKNAGMQMNTGKDASIKIPSCPGNIVSIGITCSIAKSVGFSESDYSGSGTITYVVSGTDATSQTLDFAGKEVKDGYIVPKGGSTAITHIDVEYSSAKTYYTSSPVEKVTVTFALAGGQGGCQTTKINKGSQLTICAEAPTKSHSEFAGWKNGDDVYVAGTAYTFDADITLTAQWNDAATYTVTYNVNGSEDAAPTQEAQYAGDQFAVADGVTKEGYTFKGWLYNNKLYKAGAQFTMPAANVEFVANWKKNNIATEKMLLISDANGLSNGMAIALGCSYGESNFAMAGDITGTNKHMNSVSGDNITLNNGLATFTEDVITMIAEQVEGGWKLRKDDTHYLTLTGTDVKWDTQNNATAWTISFSNGNVQIASGNNKMQFNSSSPRFKTYTSNQTAIQLFGKATVITNDAKISDLGYEEEGLNIVASGDITLTIDEPTNAQSITATNGATVVIDAQTTAQSVNVEEGSKIEANEPTTTPVVTFATTLGSSNTPSTGSALGSADNITLAAGGEIHYDITLGVDMTTDAGKEKAADQWHAFTVPFPVDVLNGIYNAATDAKLTNEVDYAIMDYHGDIRANGDYGWKKYRGTLVPGTFYIMTVNGDVKTFRFKISTAAEMVLPALNSMEYTAYGVTDPENTTSDQGWNGIGNPSWVSVTVSYPVQVLDPYGYEYQTLPAGTVISASTPFFYKANATSTMTMTESNANAQYAPRRTPANEIKNMAVRFGNEVFADKLYVTASEDALNSYEQDKDLVKMTMSKTPKVAQIFGDAYGMKLSMVNTPLVNDNAEVALTLYAPAQGEYTISVPAMEGYQVYLLRDGAVIWNLSASEYTAEFAKGNNDGYSIRIIKIVGVATDIDNIYDNASGVQKVVMDNNVFILRGEQMFDVTGKMVK